MDLLEATPAFVHCLELEVKIMTAFQSAKVEGDFT